MPELDSPALRWSNGKGESSRAIYMSPESMHSLHSLGLCLPGPQLLPCVMQSACVLAQCESTSARLKKHMTCHIEAEVRRQQASCMATVEAAEPQNTIRFESAVKILAECMLKYSRISWCRSSGRVASQRRLSIQNNLVPAEGWGGIVLLVRAQLPVSNSCFSRRCKSITFVVLSALHICRGMQGFST